MSDIEVLYSQERTWQRKLDAAREIHDRAAELNAESQLHVIRERIEAYHMQSWSLMMDSLES